MRRLLTTATLLTSFLGAGSLAAQPYPAQPYPGQAAQPYPAQPAQPYPAQPYPGQAAQSYPGAQPYGQPYPAAQTMPPPQPYGAPVPPVPSGAFGAQGQFILSADRLFGVNIWSAKIELDNETDSASGTGINLLQGNDVVIPFGMAIVTVPYATPRLGFDYTAAANISVGGGLSVVTRSGTNESTINGTTASQDQPSVTGFSFSPRFGYILGINPTISLWFRGGITYFSQKWESKTDIGASSITNDVTVTGLALNLEPQLVITPVPHFGLTAGLAGDIPLSGNATIATSGATSTSQDRSTKITNFGLSFGLLGYL